MPKIVGASLEEHREQTRSRIFAALSDLMYERGYDAITLADIAAAAGIARTAMYNYFPDKESLLVAYTEREMDGFAGALRDALAALDNPLDQLRAYVRVQLEYLATHHLPPGPALRNVISDAGYTRMVEHAHELEATLRTILATGMERDLLPPQDLDALVPLVNACINRGSAADLAGDDLADAIGTTETFVLRAVGARGI